MAAGPERGLSLIDQIGLTGDLSEYHIFYAARADLLRRLGRHTEAAEAYARALDLARNPIEQNYIRSRLALLQRQRR